MREQVQPMDEWFLVNFGGFDKLSGGEKKKRFGDLDIVMTGFAGVCGCVALAYEEQDILQSRYPETFLKKAQSQEKLIVQIPNFRLAGEVDGKRVYSFSDKGIIAMFFLSAGGVFSGLWDLGEYAHVGVRAYLKQIPIKQETVEICNFFDVNPYQMHSKGCCLLLTENGYRLKLRLWKKGIFSEVIGMTTKDNDRVVINGEEMRYLEKQYADALAIVREKCAAIV